MSTDTEQFDEILDVDDLADDGAAVAPMAEGETSFASIYQQLLELQDMIIEIGEHDLGRLRDGLADVKYRTNQRAQKAGVRLDKRRIEYAVIDNLPETGTIKVRVSFKQGNGLKIIAVQPNRGEIA